MLLLSKITQKNKFLLGCGRSLPYGIPCIKTAALVFLMMLAKVKCLCYIRHIKGVTAHKVVSLPIEFIK